MADGSTPRRGINTADMALAHGLAMICAQRIEDNRTGEILLSLPRLVARLTPHPSTEKLREAAGLLIASSANRNKSGGGSMEYHGAILRAAAAVADFSWWRWCDLAETAMSQTPPGA
ncbi:MAG: hypothetical protein V4747_11390 [Pseudomonadota bacterium]